MKRFAIDSISSKTIFLSHIVPPTYVKRALGATQEMAALQHYLHIVSPTSEPAIFSVIHAVSMPTFNCSFVLNTGPRLGSDPQE